MLNQYAVLRFKRASVCLMSLCLMALFLATHAVAQTAQLDVDRLYEKYKGQTETTIFVGNKEIPAKVLINFNANNRPYRIVIYGEAAVDSDMEQLIDQLRETKMKSGYKRLPHTNVVNFDQYGVYENNITVAAFQKGTQYAKYGIKKMEDRNQLVTEGAQSHHDNDFFYFEVGDTARMKTRKPEKFDF